jgi:hypothetical protein
VRKFLLECSGQDLTEFLLAKHASAANFRSTLFDLIDQWVEAAADARLAAEVNAIREEVKHRSVTPFPKKVQEPPPHPETPTTDATLNETEHGWRHVNAVGRKNSRHFFKR